MFIPFTKFQTRKPEVLILFPPTQVEIWGTDAAILGLPSEEIQQCSQWLPNEHKADPENHIPCGRATEAFDLG